MGKSMRKKLIPVNISGMFPGFSGRWYLDDYTPKSADKISAYIIGYKLGDPACVAG